MRDAVDDLIWDEAPKEAKAVAVLDAPALVDDALTLTDDVRVFCDDWRDAARVDPALLVEHPNDLAGVDLALARIPKSLAALDEQAAVVQGAQDVTFVGGARIKHLNHTMNQVLNKHFAAVSASLGRAKARVLRAWGPRASRPTGRRSACTRTSDSPSPPMAPRSAAPRSTPAAGCS